MAQPTPGTSSGTDSVTIPPLLTEPLNKVVLSQSCHLNPIAKEPPPHLRHGVLIQWFIQCSSEDVLVSSTGGIVSLSVPLLVPGVG